MEAVILLAVKEMQGERSLGRVTRRCIATFVATAVMLVFSAGPASAADQKGHVYRSSILCTWSQSWAEDGDYANGYSAAKTAGDDQLQTAYGSYDCMDKLQKWPSGYLAVKRTYYKYTGSEWYVCRNPDWHYNQSRSHSIKIQWHYKSLPCGRGYYGTQAHSFVKNGGQWFGGLMWSGSNHV
jgi:hypothetical protein